jgi:hypothetical protein
MTHELQARMTIGRLTSADFTSRAQAGTLEEDGESALTWAHRLATALAGVLTALGSATQTHGAATSDGGMIFTRHDGLTVIRALTDGCHYRTGQMLNGPELPTGCVTSADITQFAAYSTLLRKMERW